MRVPRIRLAALALASGLILGGCAYDMYGDPYGYGYDPYGYGYGQRSGVSIGIGYGSGYGGYGYGGYGYPYGGYGYGGYPYGGYDPFGWYGDYYYPGSGVYVYDRSRTRRVWTDEQRRYWESRRNRWQSRNGTSTTTGENWSGWDRSHWRDRNNSMSTTSPTSRTWTRDTANHGNWQTHSPVTTSGERDRSSDGGHHSREHSAERPN